MAKIKDIKCREIFGSTGLYTIETSVILDDGTTASASVPEVNPAGKYAAVTFVEQRQDEDHKKSIMYAISNVQNIIATKLNGMDAQNQKEIDGILINLDSTQNKSKLGASATLSVSIAAAKAAAKSLNMPLFIYLSQFLNQEVANFKLPIIISSLIQGGRMAEYLLDFNDFLLVPASFRTFADSLELGHAAYLNTRQAILNKDLLPLYSMQGGFAVPLQNNEAVFSLLTEMIETMNVRFGYDVFLGVDVRANAIYNQDKYRIRDFSMSLGHDELISFYTNLTNKYHTIYIEDPLADDDTEGWEKMSKQVSQDTIIAGNEFTATNINRVQNAVNKKLISAVVIDPVQAGTVFEAITVLNIARASGTKIIVSKQTGGTPDEFLSDFAVAVMADYVKFGPINRGENVVNYNRLLEIDKLLNKM